MKKVTVAIISAAAGSGFGALISQILCKRRYEKKLREAIILNDAVNAAYKKAEEEEVKEHSPIEDIQINFNPVQTPTESIKETINAMYGADTLPDESDEKKGVDSEDLRDPFYIDDDEFGSEYYDKLYWTVYHDGVIADERDTVIKNPALTLGDDIYDDLRTAGDDYRYVRNVPLGVDIEIAFSVEDYADVISKHPYGV